MGKKDVCCGSLSFDDFAHGGMQGFGEFRDPVRCVGVEDGGWPGQAGDAGSEDPVHATCLAEELCNMRSCETGDDLAAGDGADAVALAARGDAGVFFENFEWDVEVFEGLGEG